MLRPSMHFVNNWLKRVGSYPGGCAVRDMIEDSIRIQKGRKVVTDPFSEFKTLSIYWHADLNLIFLVDRFTDTIVSVHSKKSMPKKNTISEFFVESSTHWDEYKKDGEACQV